MKEHPILFSAPMVRALLAGTKTQTRRVVKPQPSASHYLQPMFGTSPDGFAFGTPGLWREVGPDYPDGDEDARRCPYGVAGDQLWVRETWAPAYCSISHEYGDTCYFEWREEQRGSLTKGASGLTLHYRADGEDGLPAEFTMEHGSEIPWRPSIHMPRWASRITLEVTSVRVERLQSISEEDAKAEGVDSVSVGDVPRQARLTCRDDFAQLWDIINGKRAPWSSNPWVWVVGFRRLP